MKGMRAAVAAALIGAVAIAGAACDESSGGAGDGSNSRVELDRAESWCNANIDPVLGTPSKVVKVHVTLQNTGTDKAEPTIQPIRSYSDGSSNESPLDAFSVEIEAGATRKGYIDLETDATHLLTGCAVKIDDGSPISLDVR